MIDSHLFSHKNYTEKQKIFCSFLCFSVCFKVSWPGFDTNWIVLKTAATDFVNHTNCCNFSLPHNGVSMVIDGCWVENLGGKCCLLALSDAKHVMLVTRLVYWLQPWTLRFEAPFLFLAKRQNPDPPVLSRNLVWKAVWMIPSLFAAVCRVIPGTWQLPWVRLFLRQNHKAKFIFKKAKFQALMQYVIWLFFQQLTCSAFL